MKILILQDEPSAFFALRRSLEKHHDLIIVSCVDRAMEILHGESVDLIVSRVHLNNENVFDFLSQVKGDKSICHIPFVCFSGRLSNYAFMLDKSMDKLSKLIGADNYIRLEEFCVEGACDFETLRRAIEKCSTCT